MSCKRSCYWFSVEEGEGMTANKCAAGNGGIGALFHIGRACPALPERNR